MKMTTPLPAINLLHSELYVARQLQQQTFFEYFAHPPAVDAIEKSIQAHFQSISETGMYRYKQQISPKLNLRNYNAQVGEALAGVKSMNKVIGLAMPIKKQAT
mgnify:CR=1 FL=1